MCCSCCFTASSFWFLLFSCQCSKTCGFGRAYRESYCFNSSGMKHEPNDCEASLRPSVVRPCYMGPCKDKSLQTTRKLLLSRSSLLCYYRPSKNNSRKENDLSLVVLWFVYKRPCKNNSLNTDMVIVILPNDLCSFWLCYAFAVWYWHCVLAAVLLL